MTTSGPASSPLDTVDNWWRLRSVVPPLPDAPRGADASGQLRADLTRFIGRRQELAVTVQALKRSRLVTLTGIGGVGKTRLALEAAREAAADYDDVRVVALADVLEPALLGHTVNTALGLRERSARWRLETVVEFLRERRVLLVLDNCEHLVEQVAPFAEALLRHCPEVSILATSRQSLDLDGEAIVPVPPLSVAGHERGPGPGSVSESEAVSLFLDRAAAALPGFTVTQTQMAHVVELCRLLDGIPLAIELAAGRLRLLPLAELVARTGDRFRLLGHGSRAAPARHQTLRAAIDGTYELCSATERVLWSRLAVFAGGFSLDAAESITSGDEVSRESVLDLVAGLVDKSIVTRVMHEGEARYVMLETIRQYGAEKLDDAEAQELSQRHRGWFVSLAERADREWSGPHQVEWLTRLRLDYANLRSALQSCLTDDPQQGLRLAWSIENFWLARGFISEARLWLDELLAADPTPSVDRGRALRLNSWLAILQGDHTAVPAMLDEAGGIARETGDALLDAYVVQGWGILAMFQGDLATSIERLEAAVAAFAAVGHPTGEMHTLFELGISYGFSGDVERAAAAQRRCQDAANALGESWWRSFSLWAYGIDKWRQGHPAEGAEIERESLRLKRQLDDQLGVGVCLEAMSWIAASEGDSTRTARLLGAADALLRTVGMSIEGSYTMWDHHRETEENLRRAGSSQRLRRAYAQGAGWGVGEAIAYALGETTAAESTDAVPLTRRELEVAELVARGMTNRQIATALVISVRTAEKHLDHILSKLNLANRAQLAAWVAARRRADSDGPEPA